MDISTREIITRSKPRVVGTVSRAETLSHISNLEKQCDIVEVRLDGIGIDTPGWMQACQSIESSGFPTILTLRLASEGGNWGQADAERKIIFESALDCLSLIDIELNSVLSGELCCLAEKKNKPIIVSYHNFEETPPFDDLKKIVLEIHKFPMAIPKIATHIECEQDIATLQNLLNIQPERNVCIIGMGDLGRKTRFIFPALGSCLTYGYIDSSSAPGQWPASLLADKLRYVMPKYNEEFIIRHKVLECI